MAGMTSPSISVVTPTRNRRDVLLRAIRSVLAQTVTDFEHLIVDDDSSDGTAEAVRGLADPRVRYLRLPVAGGANAARNAGIEQSRSPMVTFLDSDDVFLPDRLEHTLSHFAGNPDLSLMISSFVMHKSKGGLPSVNGNCLLSPSALEEAVVCQTIHIGGSAITARREALLAAGSFDPAARRFQDKDLILNMSQRGGALLSERIDWVKYASRDSISRERGGFIRSYGDFVERHRKIMDRHPSVPPFMVCRRLLMNLLQGHPRQALRDYRENLAHPALGYPPAALVRGYFSGRSLRNGIRNGVGKELPAETGRPGWRAS